MRSSSVSAEYRSIVVRYRPWQRIALIIIVAVSLLLVAMISTWWGSHYSNTERQRLTIELSALNVDLVETQKLRDKAEQQLANEHVGADIDRAAVNKVRELVRDYQQTIAELNEEISFYKGLMIPSERERGLSVRSVDWFKTATPGQIQFKLVVQQTALKHRLLRGSMRVDLVGWALSDSGEQLERRYSLSDLSAEIKKRDIALRFKYFQNIEGELFLPKGFDVQKVELVARASAPKKVQIEKIIDWQLQDH